MVGMSVSWEQARP